MILHGPWVLVVVLDAVVWAGWSLLVGRTQARRFWRALQPGFAGRIRPWERDGAWYVDHLALRRWKHRLPEAGSWFGGLSKRRLPSPRQGGLARFEAECLRAERTHGWILAITPVFIVWNPWGLFVANLGFAVAANVPCWVVARSNRARLEAVARRRSGPSRRCT